MDWKRAALEDIRLLETRRMAVRGLEERIALLDAQLEAGARMPVDMAGGGRRKKRQARDRMAELVAERERLRLNHSVTKGLVRLTERGLCGLDARGREVLTAMGGRQRDAAAADRLAQTLSVDRATVYRMRDEALREFTMRTYGLTEL